MNKKKEPVNPERVGNGEGRPVKQQIWIDANAIDILRKVKEEMRAAGIAGNSYSAAIRYMRQNRERE